MVPSKGKVEEPLFGGKDDAALRENVINRVCIDGGGSLVWHCDVGWRSSSNDGERCE